MGIRQTEVAMRRMAALARELAASDDLREASMALMRRGGLGSGDQ